MEYISAILGHWPEITAQAFFAIGGIVTFLGALYAIALIIPGEQPDKTIKKILDFTEKLSNK